MTPAAAAEVLHVVPGPTSHGITRHALQLLARGRAPRVRVEQLDRPASQLVADLLRDAGGRGIHLHLNDSLLGGDTVEVVRGLAEQATVSATLHDLPDPREGAGRYTRRARAYTELWRHCTGVVVASHHERTLLHAAAATVGARPVGLAPVQVVPLPLTPPGKTTGPGTPGRPAEAGPTDHALEPVVCVLGYLYPGKGHEQGLALAAALGLQGVVALGTTSPGHAGLERELQRRAGQLGISWEVTGFLPDEELLHRARSVALPLAWHAHASASGSIGSWLQAGRRPLVAGGGWARELERRCPGSVNLVAGEHRLVEAARAALADPCSTFLSSQTRLTPTVDQAWWATDRAVHAAHRLRETP